MMILKEHNKQKQQQAYSLIQPQENMRIRENVVHRTNGIISDFRSETELFLVFFDAIEMKATTKGSLPQRTQPLRPYSSMGFLEIFIRFGSF